MTSTLLLPEKPGVAPHSCFHCQEECPDERLHIDDKYFCCDGCKMVYEILNTHNLCEYYSIDTNPGQSLKNQRNAKVYAYLDDPEVQEKLLEFNNGQMAQASFYLPQMHCVSCLWLLENIYKLDGGVIHSRVNFLKKTASIQFNPGQTSLRKLAALLSSIGYEPEINLGDVENIRPKGISKKLAYQLGIAGFAFGNIMLFSFPEYVGLDPKTDPWFAAAFGYLSVLIAIPVLLISSRDYIQSAWTGLRKGHLNIDVPLSLALLSLFGRSIWEIFTHTGPGYLDSFAGLTFLLLIGKWFQQRTWHQLSFERDYKSYFPVAATLKNGETETSVAVNRLVPGDIIIVRSQEIIPADGILLRGSAQIDYSFVTGEAAEVTIHSGERIFAGGKQQGESIEISLTRRVSQSYLTQLWNDQAFNENEPGQVTRLADQAGRIFSWLILLFGVGAFVYWAPMSMATAINAFTAVMIVACPCTVALSIPFTLGNVMRLLGRRRFYLKNIKTVEAFAAIDTVVFDKTGTITNVAQQFFVFKGKPLSIADKVAVRSLTKHSAHPLSRSLYESMKDIPMVAPTFFREIPGEGIQGRIGDKEIKIGSANFVGTEGKGVFFSVNGEVRGCFEVKSKYREGLTSVLQYFRTLKSASFFSKKEKTKAGIWLLSGDQDQDAAALAPFFPDMESMLFGRSPQEKLEFIKKLQRHNRQVMMIGDGLNDAGALRQSNLGIVVAEDTNNFTPACDAILHADEFERLPQFVQLARAGVKIVHFSYAIALSYNIFGLTYAVSGHLSPLFAAILMPASSITIVLFGVLMSSAAERRILGKF